MELIGFLPKALFVLFIMYSFGFIDPLIDRLLPNKKESNDKDSTKVNDSDKIPLKK